jgi:hypothetical protein
MSRHGALAMLFVEGGVHRAAAVPLPAGETAVGADAASAVVVSDLPAPNAFRLKWDGRSIRLASVDCDAIVNGKVLARGGERKIKQSSRFICGNVAFRLELPPAEITAPRRTPWGFAAGVALALTATLVAAPAWPPPMRFSDVSRDSTGALPPVAASVSGKAASAPVKPFRDVQALVGDMRRQIASAGLDGISVDLQSDGAIAASGRILPAKGDAWHAALRWFDTAALGRAVVVDHVDISAAAAAASLQVQAVYTGHTPYIIDGDGEKLFVGATLADGGVIQAIESQRVLVKHGDRLAAVRF